MTPKETKETIMRNDMICELVDILTLAERGYSKEENENFIRRLAVYRFKTRDELRSVIAEHFYSELVYLKIIVGGLG